MAPANEVLGHFLALGLVWGWSFLAGLPLTVFLRAPLGFAGSVLLGLAYWAVSLYLFPFPHGLDALPSSPWSGPCSLRSQKENPKSEIRNRGCEVLGSDFGFWISDLRAQRAP